jgi:hypothetical protein
MPVTTQKYYQRFYFVLLVSFFNYRTLVHLIFVSLCSSLFYLVLQNLTIFRILCNLHCLFYLVCFPCFIFFCLALSCSTLFLHMQ